MYKEDIEVYLNVFTSETVLLEYICELLSKYEEINLDELETIDSFIDKAITLHKSYGEGISEVVKLTTTDNPKISIFN